MEFGGERLSAAQVRLIALHAIFLIPLTLFLCFYRLDAGANLGTGTGIDESWYIQVAQEMKQSGRWWFPTREGEPFFFKPPLNFWLMAISSSLFGDTVASFRFTGAAIGVLFVVLTYVVAAIEFASLNAGFFGALTLLSTWGFLFANGVRFATLDTPVTFYSAVALLIMFRCVQCGQSLDRRAQVVRGVLAGGLLAAAVLTKSVLGYYVYGILGVWMLLLGNPFRRAIELRWFFATTVLISVCVPALWFVPHAVFTPGALQRMLGYEIIDRFGKGLHNSANTWLYWNTFKGGRYLPFYGCLVALAFCVARAVVLRDRRIAFFVIWAVVPFGVFSALSSRLIWYVAPCYFPAAILCGGFLGVLIDRGVAAVADSKGGLRGLGIALASLLVVTASLWETGTYLVANVSRVIQGTPRLAIDELVHGVKELNHPVTFMSYKAPTPATREQIFLNMLNTPLQSLHSMLEVQQKVEAAELFMVTTDVQHADSMMKGLSFVGYKYLPPVMFPQGPEAVYRPDGTVVLVGSRESVSLKQLGLRSRKVVLKLASDGKTCEEVPPGDGHGGPSWSPSEKGGAVHCEFPGDPVIRGVSTTLRLNIGRSTVGDDEGNLALEVWANNRRIAFIDHFRERPQDYSFSIPAGTWLDRANSVHLELVSSKGEALSPEIVMSNQFLIRWVVVDLGR